jgi:hypothetical protein
LLQNMMATEEPTTIRFTSIKTSSTIDLFLM